MTETLTRPEPTKTATGDTAFRSESPEALVAWAVYVEHVNDVRERRVAMSERYGRGLMLNRLGFGHGTRVVGFERLATDEAASLVGPDGELRVPKHSWERTVVPNLRRKAGKDLAEELETLNQNGPNLPGMPGFALLGDRVIAPALFEHDGAIWALWSAPICDNRTGGEVDAEIWEAIPLSRFHAADEARQAGGSDE